MIHKIENFEFDKINAEGLDIGVIHNNLEDGLSINAVDDLIFHQKNEDTSMAIEM